MVTPINITVPCWTRLDDEVLFLGAIYDPATVQALRYHALGYLHGHTVGGTNPSLVEALAAGNPVIAHDNKYNTWVADDAGLYFSSPADAEKCIDELLEDPERARKLSRNALVRFESEFTWDRVAGQYEALLRKDASAPVRRNPIKGDIVVNVGIIGLGKMGLSQFSIINAHRDVKVVGVCDASGYILDILGKYTGVETYTDIGKMLDSANLRQRWSRLHRSFTHPWCATASSGAFTSSARSRSVSTLPTRSLSRTLPARKGLSPRSATTTDT